MKKLLTTLLIALVSFVATAQQSNTITFLGIPVDGKKAVVERRLRNEKGFFYENNLWREAGVLTGNFNGFRVRVAVVDYNGLVNRIMVSYPDVSETQVKIQYNNLLEQFKNSDKYVYQVIDCSGELSDEEDISYEISVNSKQYQNVFIYPPMETLNNLKKSIEEADNPEEILQNEGLALNDDGELTYISRFFWITKHAEGKVWFTIGKGVDYGKYCILIYYENEKNKPNGEDL